MNDLWAQIALVAALVLVNAALAGSEMALVSLREGQIRRLSEHGRAGALLAQLARDPNQFLATIQIGITLASALASAAAAVSLAQPLVEPLSFLGDAAEPAAVVVVTLILTFFTLVLGELAPKRIAMQRAERWALLAVRPLNVLSTLSRPAVWLLSVSTNVVVRLFGADPSRQREEISPEELKDLFAAQSGFTPAQQAIISGAFEISERALREVLIPRRDVLFLSMDLPAPEALKRLVTSGHSRAPVIGRDADNILGMVHWRDLIGATGPVSQYTHEVMVLPETLRVDRALRRLQTERQQLAVVLNEHGGTEGIVTMEDLVEELVGEIYDETDKDITGVRHEPDGSLVLAGSFPIHDLPDIGVTLPSGDYATVAGLVLERLGHVPQKPGERVEVEGWTLEVLGVERRAITRLRLRRRTDTDNGQDPSQNPSLRS